MRLGIGFISSYILIIWHLWLGEKIIKLAAEYFGPYQIIYKFNPKSYKLKLPEGSKIHPAFHVNLVKKKLGEGIVEQPELPTTHEEGTSMPIPQELLGRRIQNKKYEILILWQGLPPADTT